MFLDAHYKRHSVKEQVQGFIKKEEELKNPNKQLEMSQPVIIPKTPKTDLDLLKRQ